MKRIAALALAVALVAGLAPPAMALEKVSVGYNVVTDFLLGFIAKDQGFFEKHGLDAQLQAMTVTLAAMPAVLISGSVDIGGVTPPALLQAVANGLDLKIVAGADETGPGFHLAGIMVKPDSPIKTAKDLEGKTIGVPGLNDLLDILLRQWLIERGVDTSKVHFVEVGMVQLGDTLNAGRVDAVVPVEPFLTRIMKGGARNIGYYVDDLPAGIPPIVWATTGTYAKAHPAVIRGFKAAIADALAYYKAHPESGDESLPHYIHLPPEVLKSIPKPPMTATVDPAKIKFWVDAMVQQKILSRPIDSASVILP